ncbi:SCO2322 family protein [Streptomyces sp. URMC 123]|uniref:SCO2322 family protein n=1 Tax=Streptomyces sp. URMC 123 TaxID=3423403 RepID=UPI003F1C90FA
MTSGPASYGRPRTAAKPWRARALALALLTAVLSGVLGAALPASAAHAAGYRYWSFWQRTGGEWTYATQGPATARPKDGAVQGFRFAVSKDSAQAAQPRGAADFAAICGDTPAADGTKRVALVLDFGTAEDAPSGETPPAARTACARVPGNATAAEALAAVAEPLRYNASALLCGIAGYPASGCGEQVADSGSTAKPTGAGEGARAGEKSADGEEGGPSAGLLAGLAAVLLLGVAALWQARRRG